MGLEVDSKDVEELVQDHSTQLTTKELIYIQNEQKNLAKEQSSKDEEKTEESIPSALIKEICGKWGRCHHCLKGIHSRSDTNRNGVEGLSFYYPRL